LRFVNANLLCGGDDGAVIARLDEYAAVRLQRASGLVWGARHLPPTTGAAITVQRVRSNMRMAVVGP
jgi:hypothetical protein